jgi:hypothetical protein
MSRDITVTFDDGTTHVYRGAPDDITPEQVSARAAQEFGRSVTALDGGRKAAQKSWQQSALQNVSGGAIRGAGSIGATLLTPWDMIRGNTSSIGNPERRQAMDDALRQLGFDIDSAAYGVGKIGGEIAGTLGVGPALAGAGRAIPALSRVAGPALDALASSGMTAGGLTGKAGMALRTAAAGVSGGAAAGLVNPEDAAVGAGISALIPGGVAAAGKVGSIAARPFRSTEKKAAESLVKALEIDPVTLQQKLRGGAVLVPGSQPSISQILQTPQAGVLERVVSESPGGAQLKELYQAQNAARFGALDRVAPVDPRGFRSAQGDFGEAALAAIRGGDKSARAATRAAYESVPQTDPALYLPDLAGVRDEYFPKGAFGGRASADTAVSVADKIGNVDVPAIKAIRGTDQSLAQAVRKAGGLSLQNNDGLLGELKGLRGDLKSITKKNGGLSPGRMAEKMHEAGFIPDEDASTLLNYLRDESTGSYTGSMFADGTEFAAMRDAAMGGDQAAKRVPIKVTLGEFDALRKSIGNAQRAAQRDPDRATEALALGRMKTSLDERLDEVIRGDGAIDEALPIDWADALTEARNLKRMQVEKYRTGPQATAFRTGSDGMPVVQGGEFASKVWGNRPGIDADITQVRKALDDHPNVLGQFRSMITTEGAGTATQGGNLTGKFVRWVDNALPGLKATFSDAQVTALRNIAADIKRAEVAAASGAARGSPTYQNASNALSLGLLDSPLVNVAANRIPLVNQVSGPLLNMMRESGRNAKARGLAGLLADPNRAASAMGGLLDPRFDLLELQRGLLGAAPVLAAQ